MAVDGNTRAGADDGAGDTFDRLSVAVLSESKGGDPMTDHWKGT